MHLLIAKTLATGFTISMAFSSPTLHSFSDGAPNAHTSTATSYQYPNGLNEWAHPNTAIKKSTTDLDGWLEKLIVLESNGKEDLNILDSNGEYSFGCLQFQEKTFREFGMKYQLIAADDDIENLIYDCELQKQIAKKMIEDNYNNWRHWYTSVKIKKLGLPPKNEDADKIIVAEAKVN